MTRDRRLTPARADLAHAALRDDVEAARYAEPRAMVVTVPVLDLCSENGGLDTQLLWGERFGVLETVAGTAWGQAEDGYVGYVDASGLAPDPGPPSHRVRVRQTHRYPAPDLKTRPLGPLSYGSKLCVAGPAEGGFWPLANGAGFVPEPHAGVLSPVSDPGSDPVEEATRFLGTPYLWGGRSGLGLDCSALVQLAYASAGTPLLRDTDMQERAGQAVAPDAPAKRGDLVFWAGHVAMMLDATRVIHATAHGMTTRIEPLAEVTARIAAGGYGPITARRRVMV